MDEEADLALLVSVDQPRQYGTLLTSQDQHLLKTNLLSQRMTGKSPSVLTGVIH
jgi:hypothetical protein